MARRFSQIRNAPRLNAANTAYEAWWAARDTRTPNVGGGTARGRSKRVAVTPFGLELGDASSDAVVMVTGRSSLILASFVGVHVSDPGAGDRKMSGFKPAKVIAFFGTGTSAPATSEITNIRYLKRNGESYTHPFGAKSNTEREYEAFSEIETAITAGDTNRTVSYVAERFVRN